MTIKRTFAKTYFLLIIVFVVTMMLFGVFIYHNTAETMKAQLGDKCIGIASAIAVIIEDDIDEFVEFADTLDYSGDYYNTIRPKLNRIRYDNAGSIAYLYVERRISDTKMMYLLDGEHEDDRFFSTPGYTDDLTASELKAYELKAPYVPDEFVTNRYGTLLTCYVPLNHPKTGEFLGLVGVDVSIDQYNDVMHNQVITIAMSIALLILMLVLTLLLSSSRVERLIARDNLTGAYNKAHFMRSLRDQLKYAKRKDRPVAVFMADLDHFKNINDTYGHVFGDVVLSEVSTIISRLLRKMDCLGRYGGEEFAAYLPDTSLAAAEGVVERVRKAVENARIHNDETGEDVQITVSIGLAQFEPQHTPLEILELADKALYQAKIKRNTTATYGKS